jgi:predicted RND superfamily exporter protein
MLGSATTSTKTLKLIVQKNPTSLVTSLTLKTLKPKVFSILPKNTKKEEKSSKKNVIFTLPPLITPITKSNKVFSILPNNKEKNIHKPKNKINNKPTQKRIKPPPKQTLQT